MWRPRFKAIVFSLLVLGLLWLPAQAVFAQQAQPTFTNPLGGGANSLEIILNRMVNYALGLVGIMALGALIWGGSLYIISFGDDGKIKQAKTIIFWAIVGFAIVFLAFVILNTVARFLGAGV